MKRFFYTDGSCSNNGYEGASGGFGVVEIDENDQLIHQYQEFKEPTTNNEMELMAILYVLRKLDKEKNLRYNFITDIPIVFSDSAYCVNIINNWMYNWANNDWVRQKNQEIKNLEIIKQIYELRDLAEVRKVKGHSDNKWNNYVDELATGKRII